MKKFGITSAIAAGFVAALLGVASPAHADLGHNQWVHNIQQTTSVDVPAPVFGNGR